MADLSLRRTTSCLGCDALMPNAALDAVLCTSCLDVVAEEALGPWLDLDRPAAPRGPGPDDEDEGDLS
jgi:hypothetical protein